LFGQDALLPPDVRGDALGAILGGVGAGVAAALGAAGRSSDRERPLAPGWDPVACGNCGRKTDKVRLLPSNRSPRVPRAPGVFTSRMPIFWICVWLAVSTRDTGMPRLTTRVLLLTIVADVTVWL